jgi:hypothetical protein
MLVEYFGPGQHAGIDNAGVIAAAFAPTAATHLTVAE